MGIKHAKTSLVADSTSSDQVQPSDWNADHLLSGLLALLDPLAAAPNKVLGFDGASQPILLDTASFGGVNSPAFTGIPTAPTAALGTNTTQLATMAAVQAAIDALLAGAPGALNTLKELADAINDDASYAATITAALALKAPLASPTFTGTVGVPAIAGTSDNSAKPAPTSFVQAVAAATLAAANVATFSPNFLINQDFRIDQRNEGATKALPGGSQWAADRWLVTVGSAIGSMQRFLTGGPAVPNVPSFARIQRTAGNTGTGAFKLGQIIESAAMLGLAGQNVTLSFYARCGANYSPTSSLLNADVRTGTVADEGNANFFNNSWTGAASASSSTVALTTSWQRFSIPMALGATALELGAYFTMNPIGTAGANDYFDITGIKLELGSAATALEALTYGEVLRRCQRYYEKTVSQGTVPAQNNAGAGGYIGVNASSATAGTASVCWNFKATKRVAPTITTFNPFAAGTGFSQSGAGNVAAAVTVTNDSATTITVNGAMAAANFMGINATADAEL